jgi:hypothetical protein
MSVSTSGLYLAAAGLCGVSGFIVAGRLMDRLGRKPVFQVYMAGALVFGVWTFQTANTGGVMLPVLCLAIFFGLGSVAMTSAFSRTAPNLRAVAGGCMVPQRLRGGRRRARRAPGGDARRPFDGGGRIDRRHDGTDHGRDDPPSHDRVLAVRRSAVSTSPPIAEPRSIPRPSWQRSSRPGC